MTTSPEFIIGCPSISKMLSKAMALLVDMNKTTQKAARKHSWTRIGDAVDMCVRGLVGLVREV